MAVPITVVQVYLPVLGETQLYCYHCCSVTVLISSAMPELHEGERPFQ